MEIFYIIVSIIVVAAIVYAVISKKFNYTILAGGLVAAFLLPLPVYAIWTNVAKDDAHTFYEYWNGSEISADLQTRECQRDGSCQNTYQCDPYTVYETETYTDSEGNLKTRTVSKTKYHSCPYSSQETLYTVNTTLGGYDVEGWLMTGEPFRFGTLIPGGQVTDAPVLWTEAKSRIDSGKPGGVTKSAAYKNYILASDRTLFKQYSDVMEEYKTEGVLPAPASNIIDLYDATKVYNAGVENVDTAKFADDVQYLNAAFGSELYGDLHIVFVDSKKALDPTNYTNALRAYWTSKELGKHAIAKNTMVIIVGVEKYKKSTQIEPTATPSPEQTTAPNTPVVEEPTIKEGTPVASWVRAFTGMPVGNESLMTQIQSDLQGEVISSNFIGHPNYDSANGSYVMSDGLIENILFGTNKFERVSMNADDTDDNGGGFQYLAAEWEPDAGTIIGINIVSSILVLFALGGAGMLGLNMRNDKDYLREITTALFAKERK
jgi:hypothetical protein